MRGAVVAAAVAVAVAAPAEAATAPQVYEKSWERVRHLYGQVGQPAPEYVIERGANSSAGGVASTLDGRVSFGQRLARALTWRRRAAAKFVLYHEWAHVFQAPSVLAHPRVEHWADRFAQCVEAWLYGGRPFPARLRWQFT